MGDRYELGKGAETTAGAVTKDVITWLKVGDMFTNGVDNAGKIGAGGLNFGFGDMAEEEADEVGRATDEMPVTGVSGGGDDADE